MTAALRALRGRASPARCAAVALCVAAALPAALARPVLPAGGVEIRRTTDGIPHLRAASWRALGEGVGYVQAQDALCTLAEAFTTYRGERSLYFGADGRPARGATFGRPRNLELDLFFRSQADDAMLARARVQQPPDLLEAIAGYAAGYNRYLAEARRTPARAPRRVCLNQPWVREIAADDLLRRFYAAQVAAGQARFVAEIANARPPSADTHTGATTPPPDTARLRARLAQQVGDQPSLGSNMLAFGRQATGEEGAVLFGNPHWYWGGPDRFYQMHLTIPGRLDVAGVAFLGVPLVMIGFNDHVAWSHTVSTARRFGLFDLTLDPADPTRYQVDGVSEPLQAREVTVPVRGPDGRVQAVTRTLYRSRHGPLVDLGQKAPALGWAQGHALAMRDVNAENFRVFRNYFYWNQARSLDEFIAIQRREAATAWVNTAAIARGDGRVWLGDVGAVPDVPDALRAACRTARGQGFAALDAAMPFLDGSRSACDWPVDPAAVQAGAMPAAALPGVLRDDHVANMNDSHWLPNPQQRVEGYPATLGGERQPLSLRARLGHRIALELMAAPTGSASSARALSARVMQAVLAPRAWSAELFKAQLLAPVCANPVVTRGSEPAGTVDLAPACEVLRRWSGEANAGDRGALLWDDFWERLDALPDSALYRVPFSPDDPLNTPRGPRGDDPRIAQALADTVASFHARGLALDAPVSQQRHVLSGGQRLPLYGGCHAAGYFTALCDSGGGQPGAGPDTVANSYLQVVRFGPQGVEARTLLAHGEDESAVANGSGSAPVARYARKAWLHFPFREAQIARDPGLSRQVLRPQRRWALPSGQRVRGHRPRADAERRR